MNPLDYLRALRRRWAVILAALLVAAAAGWLTSSSASNIPQLPKADEYRATAVILATGQINVPGISSLDTLAALVTVGELPRRVAEAIGSPEDPLSLATKIEAIGDSETSILEISATSSDPREAKVLANTFATELLVWLEDEKAELVATQSKLLSRQVARNQRQIEALDEKIKNAPESERPVLSAKRSAKVQQYGLVYQAYQQVVSTAAATIGLQTIEKGSALPVLDEGVVIQPPQTQSARMVLALILGLAAGLALALVLERYDTRIRTKRAAEEHFRLPVLAEIPSLSRRRRRKFRGAPALDLNSPWAESFRLLAAGIVTSRPGGSNGSSNGDKLIALPNPASDESTPRRRPLSPAEAFRVLEPEGLRSHTASRPSAEGKPARNGAPQTVLVASAGPSEGKTTVVSSLAASLAEAGRKVLVVSCDFRRPRVHEELQVPPAPGLAEALASTNGHPILNGHAWSSPLATDVRVVPSGSIPDHPVKLLNSENMQKLLHEARRQADVVLLDTTPLLASGDSALLMPEVDAVLLVARAGKTTAELAERTAEVLDQLGAPVVGIALNGVRHGTVPRGYSYGKDKAKSRKEVENSSEKKKRKGFPRLVRHSKKRNTVGRDTSA